MNSAAQPANMPSHEVAENALNQIVLPKGRQSMRWMKIGAAIAVLLVGGYGIFSEQQFIVSNNAVVTAYVISVRTPIEGNISGLTNAVGARISEHSVIGHVDNPRVDQQHLQSLRDIEAQAGSGADSFLAERSVLETQRRELLLRAGHHIRAVATRLSFAIAEAGSMLAAKQASFRHATAELHRQRQLHESGIISDAELDRTEADTEVAEHEVAAQQADLEALEAEEKAAGQGILSEPGINDVAYSHQRADEISLRLAEIDRTLLALGSEANQAKVDVGSEGVRAELLRGADLISPQAGVLWKLEAMNGEHVAAGDSVLQIVDCSQDFILAEISQERVPELALGGEARFKLSGESAERIGIVLSVSGNEQKDENQNLAAFPPPTPDTQNATVRVGLWNATGHNDCIVGRTARVLLPTKGSSAISRWYRHYF